MLYPVWFRCSLCNPGGASCLGQSSSPHTMYEVDDGVILLDGLATKVFSDCICQFNSGLPPEVLAPRERWGV